MFSPGSCELRSTLLLAATNCPQAGFVLYVTTPKCYNPKADVIFIEQPPRHHQHYHDDQLLLANVCILPFVQQSMFATTILVPTVTRTRWYHAHSNATRLSGIYLCVKIWVSGRQCLTLLEGSIFVSVGAAISHLPKPLMTTPSRSGYLSSYSGQVQYMRLWCPWNLVRDFFRFYAHRVWISA